MDNHNTSVAINTETFTLNLFIIGIQNNDFYDHSVYQRPSSGNLNNHLLNNLTHQMKYNEIASKELWSIQY